MNKLKNKIIFYLDLQIKQYEILLLKLKKDKKQHQILKLIKRTLKRIITDIYLNKFATQEKILKHEKN